MTGDILSNISLKVKCFIKEEKENNIFFLVSD